MGTSWREIHLWLIKWVHHVVIIKLINIQWCKRCKWRTDNARRAVIWWWWLEHIFLLKSKLRVVLSDFSHSKGSQYVWTTRWTVFHLKIHPSEALNAELACLWTIYSWENSGLETPFTRDFNLDGWKSQIFMPFPHRDNTIF